MKSYWELIIPQSWLSEADKSKFRPKFEKRSACDPSAAEFIVSRAY